ncbi:MAG: CARDB domain-containing protein, partial [Acidobacteriota bacterium]
VLNQGTDIQSQFVVSLTVDGQPVDDWSVDGLAHGGYAFREGFRIFLPLGPHELRLVADSRGFIAESDEANNEITRIVEVEPAPADICAGRDDACCLLGDDLPELAYHPRLTVRMGRGGFVEFLEVTRSGVEGTGQHILCGNPLMEELKFLADLISPNGPTLRFLPQEPGDSVEVGSKGTPFSEVSFDVGQSLTVRRRGLPVWSVDSFKGRPRVRIDADLFVSGSIIVGKGRPATEAALEDLQRELASLRAEVQELRSGRGGSQEKK